MLDLVLINETMLSEMRSLFAHYSLTAAIVIKFKDLPL
jgi:hypothetical protein